MDVQEFIEYWRLERSELALLLNKSVDSVNQWLAPNTARKPPDEIRRLLATIHLLWLRWEAEVKGRDSVPVELESMFQIAMARKKLQP